MPLKSSIMFGLVLFALPPVAESASGQALLGVAAGIVLPTGPMADAVDVGYNLTGSVSVLPALSPVGFRFEGMFNEFNFKTSLLGAGSGRKERVVAGIANAMITAPGVMGPYLLGGLGVYDASCSGACSGPSQSNVGFNAGGGYRFGLSGFSAHMEARYHYVTGSGKTRFIPLTFGVTF